ncbi:MAG: ABC transporter substrate-binding protein [Hymenobacter sp.]
MAQELGYYAEADLLVNLLSPAADNYATTPAKKLETGAADFAIAPFESVISLNTKANHVPAVAVAALLQADISSVAVLKKQRPGAARDLDGCAYASYQARYEDKIVQQLVINDGGAGDLRLSYPPKLGIWETLLTGAADATWIFDNWEGIEAETNGVQLTKFRLADYGIPYGYSPVLLTTRPAARPARGRVPGRWYKPPKRLLICPGPPGAGRRNPDRPRAAARCRARGRSAEPGPHCALLRR